MIKHKKIETLEYIIEIAEEFLHQWLRLKQAFHMERLLVKPNEKESIAYWKDFLSKATPELINTFFFNQSGMYRIYDKYGLALTNFYTFRKLHQHLDIVDYLESGYDRLKGKGTLETRAKARESIGYLLTERSVGWATAICPPDIQLNFNHPEFCKALKVCQEALKLAQKCSNSYAAHRALYNLGRIHYETGVHHSGAFDFLFDSLCQLEKHIQLNVPHFSLKRQTQLFIHD